MAFLSRNDIEAIAARVTNDYRKLPRFKGQLVERIDPEILCCELCRLSLDFFALSKSRTVLGLTSFSEMGVGVYDEEGQPLIYYLDGNTILIEQYLKETSTECGRYHFTVMHETAHQLLSRMFPKRRKAIMHRTLSSQAGGSAPVRDWAEWQADTLASALLLPVDLVWGALCRFDLQRGIKILNRVYYEKEYGRFSEMASFLGVSKQALAIRLKQLGILEREYLKDPYELVDIWMEEDELYG